MTHPGGPRHNDELDELALSRSKSHPPPISMCINFTKVLLGGLRSGIRPGVLVEPWTLIISQKMIRSLFTPTGHNRGEVMRSETRYSKESFLLAGTRPYSKFHEVDLFILSQLSIQKGRYHIRDLLQSTTSSSHSLFS
jgi:hypothetical protein